MRSDGRRDENGGLAGEGQAELTIADLREVDTPQSGRADPKYGCRHERCVRTAAAASPVFEVERLTKVYRTGVIEVRALDGVDLDDLRPAN